MSTTKIISSGDFNLTTSSPAGNVVVTTNTFVLHGNLYIAGNTTQANATITSFVDPILQLNANVSGTPYQGNSGLEVVRGNQPNVFLIYNEPLKAWQITNDGSTYANIATAVASGSYLTSVQQDLAPNLGGNLNTNNFTITSNIGVVTFDAALQIKYVASPPSPQAGYVTLYALAAEGDGQTGLYATRVGDTNQELISKRKAIIYSLIF